MEKYDADFWIAFSPILLLISLALIILWIKWPEEKARMKMCRERREWREKGGKSKDGSTDLALVTMPVWMDEASSSSSSDYDSSSSSSSSSSFSDFD